MLILQLKDTSREGDGTRASVNEKVMSDFKSQNTYSKYALEMLMSVAQKELILSPRLTEVVRREPFVNWRGGAGNNMDNNNNNNNKTNDLMLNLTPENVTQHSRIE